MILANDNNLLNNKKASELRERKIKNEISKIVHESKILPTLFLALIYVKNIYNI